MNMACRLLVAAVFALLVFGAAPTGTSDPVQTGDGSEANPFTLFSSETVSLSWDAVPGSSIICAEVVAFKPPDTTPVIDVVLTRPTLPDDQTWVIEGTREKVRIYNLMKELVDGVYKLEARVQSSAGLWSPYSEFIWVKKNWSQPPAPGGCMISFR